MPQALDLATPRLYYGSGSLSRLPELVRRETSGRALLLVVDPGIAAIAAMARRLLEEGGFTTAVFTGLGSDPRSSQIDAAAQAARSAQAALVVGIGGGSALDVAKLAAAIAGEGMSVENYALCRAPLPEQGLPCLLVPTTAGTGSEATRTAVFTTAAGAKVWAWGEELRARAAVLDPELTLGLPRHLTVATGLDALAHAVEAATSRRAHCLSNAAALHAVRLVRQALPRAAAAPEDMMARGEMLLASWLAGQAIDVAGTGIAHALGHALGEVAGIHHGRAVALALNGALPGNAAAAPAAHAAVARAFGLGEGGDEELAERLPRAFTRFLEALALDLRLPEGLDPERLLQAACKEENRPMLQANCRAYSEGDLRILLAALLA